MAIQQETSLELLAELSTVVRQGRHLSRHVVDILGSSGPGRPSISSYGVLAVLLRSGGVRVTELAAELNVDASVLSRQASALERDGYVAREPDPQDRRAARLRITPAGRRVARQWERSRAEWLRHALAGWTESDARTLVSLLGRLWTDVSSAVGRDESAGSAEDDQALTAARTGAR